MSKVSLVPKNIPSASLSPELVKEHRVHRMVVRTGDTVAILRGKFLDVEGKVSKVDRKKGYVYIEGVTREKADGTTRQVPIHSSKVIIRRLVLDDRRRKEILQRRISAKQQTKAEEKPKSRRRSRKAKLVGRKEVKKEDA